MLFLIFLSFFIDVTAEARIYDLYRSDRRFKGGFCSAISGACTADDDIVTAIFENPASLATGKADWDFDGEFVTKQNLESNSKSTTNHGETSGVIGVSYTNGHVGTGFAVALLSDDVDSQLTLFDDSGLPKKVNVSDSARTLQFRIPLGIQLSPKLSIGFALSATRHSQDLEIAGSGQQPDSVASALTFGTSVGVLYNFSPRLRFGSYFRAPTTLYETIRLTATSLATTVNYQEDLALHYPWIWTLGSQYSLRRADFLYLELDFIGPSRNAFLYSFNTLSAAAGDDALTPKGRNLAVEPHIGYRTPLGKTTRLHLGTYYEPSRIEGVSNRLHGTTGVSFDAFHIAEVIGGLDYATRFIQVIFTFR